MANKRFIDFPIATTVGDNDIILIWQGGANKQTTKATILSGVPDSLNDLTDVTISGLTNGQILRYDSVTGQWENTDQGNLDLNDLNDVTIVSPTNGQVLVYNSSTSKWENSSGGYVPYVGAVTTVNLGAQTIQAGSFVKQSGTSSQFLKADGSVDSTAYGTGSVTSVGLTMPAAFNVSNSPITTAGTLAVTGAGTVAQYIRGDGSLADFPESSGGGSSVSYYLNGSVDQGTIGGIAYKELSKVPILGAGTDFTINADGYIASFITDAGDPNLLEIPGGNWNFETYFSASSGGGSPTFYVELYKVSGTTATLIASSSSAPELIAFGTNLTPYFSSLAVPTTTLALTDRLAVRYYVTHSGRTITLHTENNHLCQIITTFTTGLTALNGLTAQVQNFAVGTTGTDFNIASATATHTFNLPTASATNRGALSSADWSLFTQAYNDKINSAAVTGTTTKTLTLTQQDGGTITASWSDLNTDAVLSVFGRTGAVVAANGDYTTAQVTESGNLYYTDARSRAALSFVAGSGAYNSSTGVITIPTNNNQIANGAGYITSAALGGYVQGSGTTNNLPKFTGASTIGNSLFSDNGTNGGFGGTNYSSGTGLRSFNISAQDYPGLVFWANNQTTANIFGLGFTGTLSLDADPSNIFVDSKIVMSIDGTERLAIFNNGNVSIGNSPTDNGARLQVSGNSSFSGTLNITTESWIQFQGNNVLLADGGFTILQASGTGLIRFRNNSSQNLLTLANNGAATFSSLVGLGTRMVVSDASGVLSTQSIPLGTVTSVTASSPLSSSGGTTPNITIQQASGSQSGFLSSTDWNTFNNKQNSLTNPVTGTGTSGQVAFFNGTTSITSESNLFWDATNDRLGIGINIPNAELQVQKSSDVTFALSNSNSITTGNRGSISWYNSAVSTVALIKAIAITDNVGTELEFYTNKIGGSLTRALILRQNQSAEFASSLKTNASIEINGSVQSTLDLLANQQLINFDDFGRIRFGGRFNSFSYGNGASINSIAVGNWSSTNYGANLTFSTVAQNSTTLNTRMTIMHNGNVGINTLTPDNKLAVWGTNNGLDSSQGNINVYTTNASAINTGGSIGLGGYYNTSNAFIPFANITGKKENSTNDNAAGYLAFLTRNNSTGTGERMRITSGGDVFIGKTEANIATEGVQFGGGANNAITENADAVLYINRLTDDGDLIVFRQGNVTEGTISVSGTTVSYNGGHLSRYSQMESNEIIEGLVKGTVMSNLDKMAEWINPETDEPFENQQLNCMKISDVEGDKNVAGVFVNWDNDDKIYTNDMNIAMTGDMIIRIAKGVFVEKGDLLISAGDGTAKPQIDDLIRSNTIAKVTSNHVTCVYADGSYCVPCVLMAC